MTKKVIIIVVILVLVVLAVRWYNNYNRRQQLAINQQNFANNNTTATGLFGSLTDLWNSRNSADTGISEMEAEEISKKIADSMELGNEEGTAMANKLKADLYAGGWNYIDYGKVERIN